MNHITLFVHIQSTFARLITQKRIYTGNVCHLCCHTCVLLMSNVIQDLDWIS